MPPAPPVRTAAADYHYHVYDYAGSQPWTLCGAQPKRNYYRFYSMAQDLDGLRAEGVRRNVPNVKLVSVPTATTGGRATMALSFGNEGGEDGRPTVLITGGIHSREWAATEMAYLLAEYLIVNYDAAAPPGKKQVLRDLVDSRNICVIPMLNPDGNWFTVFGDGGETARLWRKNRRALPTSATAWVSELTTFGAANPPFQNVQRPFLGRADYEVPSYEPARGVPPGNADFRKRDLDNSQTGVDLNRNLATRAFGYDNAPRFLNYNPSAESYFGPKAGTETETANLRQYVASLGDVAASIDYHAFGQLILYPGEAWNSGTVGADFIQLGHALHMLIKSPRDDLYRLGTPLQLVKYEATGSVADYMAQYNRSRAFTVEVDPTNDPPPNPFQQGFMLPEIAILPMFQTNIRGALAALGAPKPAAAADQVPRRQRAIISGVSMLLDWEGVYQRGNQLPA
jgi:Zinc carboxypeptidase